VRGARIIQWCGGTAAALCRATTRASPARVAVSSFGLAVLLGALLLTLPVSSKARVWSHPVDALFTSTSAVCVTGLIVKSTPNYWSSFGQLVILGLIQAGGLGIMTMGAFAAILLQRRLSMRFEAVMSDLVESERAESVWSLVRFICVFTIALEAAGACGLYVAWRGAFPGARACVYHSVFHSISAFCNAGFSLNDGSLTRYADWFWVNVVVCGLIVVGGIGFIVVRDLLSYALWHAFKRRGRRPRLSTHTRLVLMVSAVLLVVGFFGVLIMESGASLAGCSARRRLLASVFQSVTPRTAGFNTLDIGSLAPATAFLLMALMYVGGSPGSTAGGIKTTTLGVMVASITATLKGRQKAEMFHHAVPEETVHRVASIILLSLAALGLGIFALLVTEVHAPFQRIVFDAISAFGTVGLSRGLTGPDCNVTVWGKVVLTVLMFVGRLGPVTLVLSVGALTDRAAYQFPEGRVLVG
jgi:trk system potassium uptake protein TrkH